MLNVFAKKMTKHSLLLLFIAYFAIPLCAERKFYFIEGTPLKDVYATIYANLKPLSSHILLLNADSLIQIDTLSHDKYRILDIQQNYNDGIIVFVNQNADFESEIKFINAQLSYKQIPFTKCNYYGDKVTFVVEDSGNKYLCFPTQDKITAVDINEPRNQVISNPFGTKQISGTSLDTFFNMDVFLERTDIDGILPDSLCKNDMRIGVCIYDDYQRVFIIDNRQKKDSVVYDYYNYKREHWGIFKIQGKSSTIKAFGSWLAGNIYYSDSEIGKHNDSPGKEIRDSIWNNDWYSPTQRYEFSDYPDYRFKWGAGYTADDRFLDKQIYSPGIMYLFNTETSNYLEITTYQGDSQILLVEDDIVYYRVNDEIYKVPIINGNQLGTPTLLIKNRIVVDIHWMFILPE